MTHNRSLDGVRGVAILLVILFHFGYLAVGWIGVQLFFVLSGYLITSILCAEKSQPVGFYFKRFYWRRSLRIFPLYFGYLLLLSLVYAASGVPPELSDRWQYLLTYTYNYALLIVPFHQSVSFTHLWSLAVEEQFYLLWPIVVYYLSASHLRTLIGVMLLASPAIRLIAVLLAQSFLPEHPQPGLFAYSPLLCQCDALAMGSAIAIMKYDVKRPLLMFNVVTGAALALGLVSLTLARPGWWQGIELRSWHVITATWAAVNDLGYPPFVTDRYQHVWSYSVINLWAALLIVNLRRGGRMARVLSHRFLVHSGKISYGLYVLHYPVLGLVKWIVFYRPMSPKGLLVFLPYLAAIYLLANLSFTFFESWFLEWKDARFSQRPQAQTAS
jgi:peptidoglycan/LPS O-acetylase OafA/YrhL